MYDPDPRFFPPSKVRTHEVCGPGAYAFAFALAAPERNALPAAALIFSFMGTGASFLAFANALNRGAHIRVSILLNSLSVGPKRLLEIWCFGLAAAIAAYFTYYAYWFVYWSWKFNEVSQDQDATALWIPQSVMVVGGAILTVALIDNLFHVIVKGDHRIIRDLVDQSFGE